MVSFWIDFADEVPDPEVGIGVLGVGPTASRAILRLPARRLDGVRGGIVRTTRAAQQRHETISLNLLGGNTQAVQSLRDFVGDVALVFVVVAEQDGGRAQLLAERVGQAAKAHGALTLFIVIRSHLPWGLRPPLPGRFDAVIHLPQGPRGAVAPAWHRARARRLQAACDTVEELVTLVRHHSLINVELSGLRSMLSEGCLTMVGVGRGRGVSRAQHATREALQASLSERFSLRHAKSFWVHIAGSRGIKLREVEQIASALHAEAPDDVNMFWSASFGEGGDDSLKVTLVACAAVGRAEGRRRRREQPGRARRPGQHPTPLLRPSGAGSSTMVGSAS